MRRLLPTAVAVVTVLTTGCTSSTTGSGQGAGPAWHVTCTATRNPGPDDAVVRARARTLGGTVRTVHTSAHQLSAVVGGVTKDGANALCATDRFEARGLIAPTQTGGCTTGCLTLPAGASLPTTETGYDRLAGPEKQQLADVLDHLDCPKAAAASATAGTVAACDEARPQQTYLLGPAITGGSQVADAQAMPPGGQVSEWSIELRLTKAGTTAWAAYTTAHNGHSSGYATTTEQCGAATAPCALFVGFVIDGVVRFAPYSSSAVTSGLIQFTGGFTRTSARLLAVELSGALPVALTPKTIISR